MKPKIQPIQSARLRELRLKIASAKGMFVMAVRNSFVKAMVTEPGGPVVSLTSYGPRLNFVFLAIESIARGSALPSRLILWVDEPACLANPPRTLRRLVGRGLEILPTENYGPHKKYYPFAASLSRHVSALVTADDDTIYPRGWLRELVEYSASNPDDIVCHRSHRMTFRADGSLAPYSNWPPAEANTRSVKNFPTGMGGVLYPATFVDALRDAGTAFVDVAPHADDVWLHANAVRNNRTVRQIGRRPDESFVAIRGSGSGSLMDLNVSGGRNDIQIRDTYNDAEIALIRESKIS